MKWISVKDKLPELSPYDKEKFSFIEKQVLACLPNGKMSVAYLVDYSQMKRELPGTSPDISPNIKWANSQSVWNDLNVTHWMYLPEKPE